MDPFSSANLPLSLHCSYPWNFLPYLCAAKPTATTTISSTQKNSLISKASITARISQSTITLLAYEGVSSIISSCCQQQLTLTFSVQIYSHLLWCHRFINALDTNLVHCSFIFGFCDLTHGRYWCFKCSQGDYKGRAQCSSLYWQIGLLTSSCC